MILYNMRHRGPYEYDKFVLNTLQIANAVSLKETNELRENSNNFDSLVIIKDNINNIYNNLIGTDKVKGICETIYEQSYIINGGR